MAFMNKIKSFKPKPNQPTSDQTVPQQPFKKNRFNNPKPNFNQPPQQKSGKNTFTGLKLIPLGGIGDVTKNMYVYQYGKDIMIVDCGIGFPDEAMPGIDLVIPDISYLKDKIPNIKGIVISHGHDDHIGGLPYIWPQLRVPIYAPKLAAGFIKGKFQEHNLPTNLINIVNTNSKLNLGPFEVSFYHVTHSVPDANGLVINTPVGRIVHQADFKLDWTPVDSQVTQVGKLAVEGEKGVLLMLIDSLRVEKSGYSLSERTIQPTFERIERESLGKVLITTTSSNIGRIQQAINVAVSSGRKVAFIGRSMDSNFQISRDLGFLSVPPNVVVPMEEIKRYPDNKLMLLIGGSQGQSGSALSRVANNDHRFVVLHKGDSVVFSADPIPSSESAQYALIDKLTKMGANVYYTALTDSLHVSGHASSEEIKVMINLAKPKFLIPIGATFRQMKEFSRMTGDMGYTDKQVLLPQDGQIINISQNQVTTEGKVPYQNVYVDGLGVGDISSVVLRDRQVMSEEGIVLVIVPINAQTSRLEGDPDIVSRGFVFEKEAEEMLTQARNLVKSALEDHPEGLLDWRFTRHHIEEVLEKFFYEEIKRRPMVLPVLVEV